MPRRPRCTDPTHTLRSFTGTKGAKNGTGVCRTCQAKYLREYRWKKKHGDVPYQRSRAPKRSLRCTNPTHVWKDWHGKRYCATCRSEIAIPYKREKRLIERTNKLVEAHVDNVTWLARKLARQYYAWEFFDDVYAHGLYTLARVARRFDKRRRVLFWTFAQHRVKGEMFDFIMLRKRDATREGTDLADAPEPTVQAEDKEALHWADKRAILERVIETLAPRDQTIMRRALQGVDVPLIAQELGVSPTRVWQLWRRLYATVKERCNAA